MQSTNLQLFDKKEENNYSGIKPVWEIDTPFKCPVIGTCLSVQDLKKILKKVGTCIKHLNAYQVHRTVMENMGSENKVSRKVDANLKHKFRKELSEFGSLEESEFEAAWKLHFEKGNIFALLWIAATRSDLSEQCLEQVFGDIHMLSHQNVNDACTHKQQLARQQEANKRLAEKIERARSLARRFKKERDILEGGFNEVHGAYETLKREKAQIQERLSDSGENRLVCDLRVENSKLQVMVKKYEQEILNYSHKIQFLEDQNRKLMSHLERQQDLNGELKKEVKKMAHQMSSLNQCDEQCPAFDLCAKRILIVGGITKLKAYYRELIEDRGGIFEYHDGYMNGGKRGLEGRVRRSDIILCPVKCNSHNACLSLKKLCQKHNKPVQMLSNASLNAISQALSKNVATSCS
jgi:hypothetical protein